MRSLLLLAPLAVLACTDGTDDDPNADGTAPTGSSTFETETDGPEGLTLPLAVWYPAMVEGNDSRASYAFGLTGEARVDAPIAEGMFPVIVASHGNGGARHAGATLFEQWAQAGYVVVAMDHVGNTYLDRPSQAEWIDIYVRRPLDVGAAYQAIVALNNSDDSVLSGRVDVDTVIVAGHSTGGATAILASGATLDAGTVRLACSSNQLAGSACDIADATEGDTLSLAPDNMPAPVATIVMAPLNSALFSSSLDMSGASLVVVGTRDDVTPPRTNAGPIYDDMNAPKAYVELNDANHYVFATVCQIPGLGALLGTVAEQCEDPDYMSEDDAIAATGAISIAFLDRWVGGDTTVDVGSAASGFDVTFESE